MACAEGVCTDIYFIYCSFYDWFHYSSDVFVFFPLNVNGGKTDIHEEFYMGVQNLEAGGLLAHPTSSGCLIC